MKRGPLGSFVEDPAKHGREDDAESEPPPLRGPAIASAELRREEMAAVAYAMAGRSVTLGEKLREAAKAADLEREGLIGQWSAERFARMRVERKLNDALAELARLRLQLEARK